MTVPYLNLSKNETSSLLPVKVLFSRVFEVRDSLKTIKLMHELFFFWFRLQRAEGISVPVSIVILRIHSFVG